MTTKEEKTKEWLRKMTLEEWSSKVAKIYAGVSLAKSPAFRWSLILNDITIVGEDVRRNRPLDGAKRAAKVLMRIFDFVGYYLYQADETGDSFPAFFSQHLRRPSYWMERGLDQEGPSAWLLHKFPEACAKCGEKPCECVMKPWVFEERRENPQPYMKLKGTADNKRAGIMKSRSRGLTVPAMLDFFNETYRASYYALDPWKVAMHLTEEAGEATVALNRVELSWLAIGEHLNLLSLNAKLRAQAKSKLEHQAGGPRLAQIRKDSMANVDVILRKLQKSNSDDAWHSVADLAVARFKEELCDVLSWLSAILTKLSGLAGEMPNGVLVSVLSGYTSESGHVISPACAWCKQEQCSNDCLAKHGVADELIERALAF